MEIISNDYSVIKEELLRAIDIINKSTDEEETLSSYIGITDFYEEIQLMQELTEVNEKLQELKKTPKWEQVEIKLNDYFKQRDEKLMLNGELYFEIFNKQYKTVNKIASDVRNISYDYTELDDSSIYNILYDYFSKNDSRMLELFSKYTNKQTIFPSIMPFQLGSTSAPNVFDNIYIKVRRQSNFKEMLVMLHEISHARFFEDIIRPRDDKEFNSFVCTNLYSEVYPRLQERMFLQWLLDNNILVQDVKKYLAEELLYLDRILVKSIESYNKNKKLGYYDVKDINSYLYRDLLFLNNYITDNNKKINDTALEDYYLKHYSTSDISRAVGSSSGEIKRLIK